MCLQKYCLYSIDLSLFVRLPPFLPSFRDPQTRVSSHGWILPRSNACRKACVATSERPTALLSTKTAKQTKKEVSTNALEAQQTIHKAVEAQFSDFRNGHQLQLQQARNQLQQLATSWVSLHRRLKSKNNSYRPTRSDTFHT